MSTLSYEPNWGGIHGDFQQVALIYHEEVYGTSRNFGSSRTGSICISSELQQPLNLGADLCCLLAVKFVESGAQPYEDLRWIGNKY